MSNRVALAPYLWEGEYAEMRDRRGMGHDHRLCAQARWPWMAANERVILRCCELIAHPGGYFYDDHDDVFDKDGRGHDYRHTKLGWDVTEPHRLECRHTLPGVGSFAVSLRAVDDSVVDIFLGIATERRIVTVDWGFCVVLLEVERLHDPDIRCTAVRRPSGEWAALGGLFAHAGSSTHAVRGRMVTVSNPAAVVPEALRMYPLQESVTEIPIARRTGRAVGLGLHFDRGTVIYANPENECVHVDPYFFHLEPGQEQTARGMLVAGRMNLVDRRIEQLCETSLPA